MKNWVEKNRLTQTLKIADIGDLRPWGVANPHKGMFRAIQEQISRLMKEEDAVTVTTGLMYLETLIKNKASDWSSGQMP